MWRLTTSNENHHRRSRAYRVSSRRMSGNSLMQEFPLPRLFERGTGGLLWSRFMEQKDSLDRNVPSDEAESAWPETQYALNVALVYQDAPTREWAAQVCGQVTRLAGKDAVRCTWWEISQLGDPEVLKNAVLTTTQADAIFVSIYDAKEFPVDLCVWIDAWLPRRSLSTGALIALISVPGQMSAQLEHARGYLRAVARKGRLDFLLRERKLPVASRGYLYVEKLAEWTSPATSVVQKALRYEHENLSMSNGQ
jgi:hypothetical protein